MYCYIYVQSILKDYNSFVSFFLFSLTVLTHTYIHKNKKLSRRLSNLNLNIYYSLFFSLYFFLFYNCENRLHSVREQKGTLVMSIFVNTFRLK